VSTARGFGREQVGKKIRKGKANVKRIKDRRLLMATRDFALSV